MERWAPAKASRTIDPHHHSCEWCGSMPNTSPSIGSSLLRSKPIITRRCLRPFEGHQRPAHHAKDIPDPGGHVVVLGAAVQSRCSYCEVLGGCCPVTEVPQTSVRVLPKPDPCRWSPPKLLCSRSESLSRSTNHIPTPQAKSSAPTIESVAIEIAPRNRKDRTQKPERIQQQYRVLSRPKTISFGE